MRKPELCRPIAGMLVAGSAHRQIARHLGCSPSTVTRQTVHIGRHAELFHRLALGELGPIDEPIVFDHFETFVRSQIERLGIGTAVGQRSWFVYALSRARYRSAARRSRRKRALKRDVEATPPGEIVRSTVEILEMLARKAPDGFDLISDDHPAYRSAVRQVKALIRHRAHRNPDRSPGHDAEAARARDLALFAVDLLHKLYRHCQAHHRRETIAFGRKSSNVIGRATLLAVWRNFIKLVTERRPETETPAMRIGLTDRRWSWRDVFAERLFEARLAPV